LSDHLTLNQLLLVKNEAASGTEETPTPGANAVRVRNLKHSMQFDNIDTNYHQSSLSVPAPIVGGGMGMLDFEFDLKGSGAGGTAPEVDPILRANGLQAVVTAAAVTGTAAAGAASSITLAAGASAVDNIYVGMPINLTAGPGAGAWNVISAYNGTTKVATVAAPWANVPSGATPTTGTSYSIPANTLYRPISTGLETLTGWAYQNRRTGLSRLRKLVGAAGTMQLRANPRSLIQVTEKLTGIIPGAPTDVTAPTTPTFQTQQARPVLNALAFLGGSALKFNEYSFDLGNTVGQFDNPAAANGYDIGSVVSRNSTGRLVPNLSLVATRDTVQDWLSSQARSFWLRTGTAAGDRVSLYNPALRYTGHEEVDVRGFAAEGVPFSCDAADAEIFICFH
jgi:hypothetical protein